MPRWLRVIFLGLTFLGVVLLVLTAVGGANSRVFERYFPLLLIVNVFITLSLFIFISSIIYRIIQRWRHGVYGSRMTGKLALTMGIMSIVPCILIYFISNQFIGRSIDSWFDIRIEHALDAGVSLTSDIMDREQTQLKVTARRIATSLSETPAEQLQNDLDMLRTSAAVDFAYIWNSSGKRLFGSMSSNALQGPSQEIDDRPGDYEFETARNQGAISQLHGDTADATTPMRICAIVPLKSNYFAKDELFLQLIVPVPAELAKNAVGLLNGYREYQELALTREALQQIYRITLTLTMLLAVFAAVAIALYMARTMTAPILQLANGTKKVAEGDLAPIKEFEGDNEINELTRSFNSMVAQVAEARTNVENQRAKAERARSYLEHILSNLSSGVIVVDEELTIIMANSGANTILAPAQLTPGQRLASIEPELANVINDELKVADDNDIHIEVDIARLHSETPITLFVRGSHINFENGHGWVIVFDDMSTVIDAQRALAWGEVARRLAHEIKNPLTPIRLAAERLQMKLSDRLDEKDAALLNRACGTIVNQVDSMKQMVNDFRDYAKLPTANLLPLNVNHLFEEVVNLYHTAGTHIETHFVSNPPLIRGDETQLRQIIHNLIGNAVDATSELPDPFIGMTTSLVTRQSDNKVVALRLEIQDNGSGFPSHILSKAFEPYITTKATGTGLGLPMVKKIVEEHRAKISLENRVDEQGATLGALVTIIFPVDHISMSEH